MLNDLPVSAAMARFLAESLKKGEPKWWAGTQKAWEKRSFVSWNEGWTLFFACVHFEALNDAESPLVPYFPSCGGTDEADPSGALAKFLADPPPSFFENLKIGQRRSYIPLRAPIWMGPAAFFFQKRELPFYLVEINAGAGLNIAADVVSPVPFFNSSLVAARIGLDSKPIVLNDIQDRRWLTACVMPDNMAGIEALDKAIEAVLERERREAAFIQLVECAPEIAARFVAKNIPAEDGDVGLMLLNMATTVKMTDPQYEAFSKAIAETMLPWGDRALWVEIETVRGETYSTTHQVRAHRLADGVLRRCVIASIDVDAQKTQLAKEGEAFLTVAPPSKK